METWLIGIGFVLGGGIILSWIMGTRAALADMDWYRNKELMQWGVLTGAFTAALSAFIAVLVVSSWWAATLWWLHCGFWMLVAAGNYMRGKELD